MKKICLVNVGANSSHGSLRSALFRDGSFEFIPIPDTSPNHNKTGLRYDQLLTFNGLKITELIEEEYHDKYVHNDPEFTTYTYGDYPTYHPRAANLRKLRRGDFLFFFARLVPWADGKFIEKPKFGLIGFIEIENIYKNIVRKPADSVYREIRNNAHVIRAESDSVFYDCFWIFKGSEKSTRFRRAVVFDKKFITGCTITDVNDQEISWHRFSSELSAIGSYFRSARLIEKKEQLDLFWERVNSKQNFCS
jgi:hypothetical protein